MATVYRSKVDAWLLLLMVPVMAAALFVSARIAFAGPPAGWWLILLAVGLGVGLPLWLLVATHYTLEPTQLLVKSGPFKWRIPVADITAISQTSNPLSSPALSLDRLRIDYGRGNALMISPRNKEQFLNDIEALRRGAV